MSVEAIAMKRPNPYRKMSLDEIRKFIIENDYQGKSIKEIAFENPKLASTLDSREINGKSALKIFYEEELLIRLRRTNNYYNDYSPKDLTKLVLSRYKGYSPSTLYEKDQLLAQRLRNIHIKSRSLMEILVGKGILVNQSKGHPNVKLNYHGKKWDSLNGGYRNSSQYMLRYVHKLK